MSNHLVVESLDQLIKAVQEYRENLQTNKQILINAGNVCDAAMGSDDIVKKHLAKLNEALEELENTSQLAADVADALIEDRRRAIIIYED